MSYHNYVESAEVKQSLGVSWSASGGTSASSRVGPTSGKPAPLPPAPPGKRTMTTDAPTSAPAPSSAWFLPKGGYRKTPVAATPVKITVGNWLSNLLAPKPVIATATIAKAAPFAMAVPAAAAAPAAAAPAAAPTVTFAMPSPAETPMPQPLVTAIPTVTPENMLVAQPVPEGDNKTLYYIAGGVALLAIAGYFIMRKDKK